MKRENSETGRSINILLVEDNPGDVRLTEEALKEGKVNNSLSVARDGAEALAFLHKEGEFKGKPTPDLILLDLNLPKLNGPEVLQRIKDEPDLKRIPVVVLTTSTAEQDVLKCYDLNANCFITKPVDLDQFFKVIRTIDEFWLNVVRLPERAGRTLR